MIKKDFSVEELKRRMQQKIKEEKLAISNKRQKEKEKK